MALLLEKYISEHCFKSIKGKIKDELFPGILKTNLEFSCPL